MAAIAPQFPVPLPPWARFVLRVGPIVVGYLASRFDHNSEAVAEQLTWRRCQMVWQRIAPTGYTEDKAICTFDLINITGGDVDNTWTDADFVACEGKLASMWTAFSSSYTENTVLDQFRWYKMQFESSGSTRPFVPPGPPVRVLEVNSAGTSTEGFNQALQVAISVTEKTPLARHWGRFYLPAPKASAVDEQGRLPSTFQDAVANAVGTCYQGLADLEFYPVVPMTQFEGQQARMLLGVNKIQVDDIPDVIRSRRPSSVKTRQIRPV